MLGVTSSDGSNFQRRIVESSARAYIPAFETSRAVEHAALMRLLSCLVLLLFATSRVASHPHGHSALSSAPYLRDGMVGTETGSLSEAMERDRDALSVAARRFHSHPFVATLTTDDAPHWDLFLNLFTSVKAQNLTLITFVLSRDSLPRCESIGSFCFYPNHTLSVSKANGVADAAEGFEWQAAAEKPVALWLSSTLRQDFLFVETDVVVTGPVLTYLSSRHDDLVVACATDGPSPEGPLAGLDNGVVFVRSSTVASGALRRHAAHMLRHPFNNGHTMLRLAFEGIARRHRVPFGCVDLQQGFSTAGPLSYKPGACFTTHAAGIKTAAGKIAWLRKEGLWFVGPGAAAVPVRSPADGTCTLRERDAASPPPQAPRVVDHLPSRAPVHKGEPPIAPKRSSFWSRYN